jgi:hypothetical protein
MSSRRRRAGTRQTPVGCRGLILHIGQDDAVMREDALWQEHALVDEDVRPLLARMEGDGETVRFSGFYRVRRQRDASK